MTAALAVTALGAGPAAAAVDPVSPAPAPAVAEGFTPYLPQVSCDPVTKPGINSMRAALLAAYGGRDLGVTRGCDVGALSEHKEGRAWDWGLNAAVPAEKAVADQFLTWLLAPGPDGMAALNARRLGVMYVVWNGRIWSAYRAAEGWRKYSGGEAHATHLHISLAWTGAMARSSWWTGATAPVDFGPCAGPDGSPAAPWSAPRATPCPAPVDPMSLTGTPLLGYDARGGYVTQLQRLLMVSPVSGWFGPVTQSTLRAYQSANGLEATGTTTPATWTAVRAKPVTTPAPAAPPPAPVAVTPPPVPTTQPVVAARSLPSTMRYTVRRGDSLSAIATRFRSNVGAIKSASRLTSDTIRVGQLVSVPVRSTLTKFTYTSLRKGSKGVAVKALQTALRMKPKYRTGLYGDITTARVNAFKTRRGWAADGVVGPGVWRALGA